MRSFIGFNRLLLAGIAAAAAALSMTPVAQAAPVARAGPPSPVVPGDIQVPAGNKAGSGG